MVSILIPTYEMAGRSVEMLNDLVESILRQSYRDYEVIVSDDSSNEQVRDYCLERVYIQYHRNPDTKGAAFNLNNALYKAKGTIIKPMFQDDQFLDPDCLMKVANISSPWAVCTSEHLGGRRPHVPYWNYDVFDLACGGNSYGSPSAVAWKANELTFDENLVWLFDCDFYGRMTNKYGLPQILDSKVLIREWDGSATNTNATGMVRVTELEYIEEKFKDFKK